jgi:rhodanese-related sulfurtransferase
VKTILLTLLTVVLFAGCQSEAVMGENVTVDNTTGSYTNVTPVELNILLKEKDFILVNVHIPFTGNIPGTDLSIPYDQIEQGISQLPAEKDARIVLYCSSGRMSQMAAEELVSLGYTNIWNLEGGMLEWKQAGFDLEK